MLCQDPLPTWVFDGSLDLDNYFVRMQGLGTEPATLGQVLFDSCEVPFDHFAQGVGANGVTATLFTPPPSCL
jgi:hypothetical protein